MLIQNLNISSKKRAKVSEAYDANIYIFWGQSNMIGDQNNYTQISSAYVGPHDCKVYYAPNFDNNGSWQNVLAGVNHQNVASPNIRFGPILNFAYRMGLNHPGKAYIIHHSVGGTQLDESGSNAILDWSPDSPNELWERLMKCLEYGWAKLIADGKKPVLRGFVQAQGEADMASAIGLDYLSNINDFYDSSKARFLSLGIPYDNLKIYISRTHDNFIDPSTSRPYMSEVRAAQLGFSQNYPNVFLRDTDAYSVASDGTHWNNAGQIQHGLDVYNYFDPLIL